MTQYISREDIEAGDSIKVTEVQDGVLVERTGKVEAVNTLRGTISTKEGGFLWHSYWEGTPTFQLLDRPKPPLPSEPGTVIIAYMPKEKVNLIWRDENWWSLDGEGFYASKAVAERPWKLAKVVEA